MESSNSDQSFRTHRVEQLPAPAEELEERLGYKFSDKALLQRALTHSSAQHRSAAGDYERLEFLGDAVLDLAIAHLLCEKYQDAPEGELSKMRAALVNTNSLADMARDLRIGECIILSRGERSAGGAERPSILADVVEALFGAIYRDGGFDPTFKLAQTIFNQKVSEVSPSDPKTELQEVLHAKGKEAPTYLLECVEGPEHAPTFVSIVTIDGVNAGRGRGGTKKASQQAAASEALTWLEERSIEKTPETGEES